MTSNAKARDLARDIRDGKVYEVMAEPGQASSSTYFLRPVGGGYEHQVLREYVEIIERAESAA